MTCCFKAQQVYRMDDRREQRSALITADSRFKHPQLDGWFSWSPPSPGSLPAINPNSVSSRRHYCCCCCCCRSCSCRLPFGGESGSWLTTPTGTLGVHIHTYTRSHSERWKCVPYSSRENSFTMVRRLLRPGEKVGLVWNKPVTEIYVDSV